MKLPRFVKDIMVRRVVTASPDAKLSDVAKLMSKRRVGSVIITKKGRVQGIVTGRDFIRFGAQGLNTKSHKAREYMAAPVATCQSNARILDALLLMRKKGIRHMPIVQGGKLAGVVSIRDLIAATELISLYLI